MKRSLKKFTIVWLTIMFIFYLTEILGNFSFQTVCSNEKMYFVIIDGYSQVIKYSGNSCNELNK